MKPSNTHGFTLIEVVIVVAIVGILSMIAIPNFIGWLPRYRLNLAAQDVLSGMIKARTKAVKDNTWVVFRPSTTNTGSSQVLPAWLSIRSATIAETKAMKAIDMGSRSQSKRSLVGFFPGGAGSLTRFFSSRGFRCRYSSSAFS